jgi:outer membrane protein assembly factor BamD (BamD/ComL family)
MLSESKNQIVLILLFFIALCVSYLGYFKYQEYGIESEYRDALSVDKLQNYNDFLKRHPNAKYSVDIKYYRDKNAFNYAKSIDTFEKYQDFLNNYPTSDWYSNVVYHRDRTALDRVKETRTLPSIVEFINNYPNSSWLPQANYYLRHTFGFNSVSEAEKYLPNYNQ